MLINHVRTLAVMNQDVGLDTLVYLCVYRDHGWRQKYGAKGMHAFIDYHRSDILPSHVERLYMCRNRYDRHFVCDIVEQTKTRQRIFSDRCKENSVHLLLRNKKGWAVKYTIFFRCEKCVCEVIISAKTYPHADVKHSFYLWWPNVINKRVIHSWWNYQIHDYSSNWYAHVDVKLNVGLPQYKTTTTWCC